MTTNGDVLIRVENLQKAFGDFHALNGITEEIHKGEVVVIIGPSGSGKSTFLRSLNLLVCRPEVIFILKVWTLQMQR